MGAITGALHNKDTEYMNTLIKAGADVNAQNDDGQTALMLGARSIIDNAKVNDLIEAGADINAQDNNGKTALMYACNPKVLNALIDAGADVNARDSEGKMAIDYARESKYLKGTDALKRLEKLSRNSSSSTATASGCMTIIIEAFAIITALVAVGCLL